MTLTPFLDRIRQTQPLLGDGAMGTLLHQHGTEIGACFDALNLTHPQQVAAVHRAYIEAGADVIETNTFGANRYKLAKHGLETRVGEINWAAAQLARKVIAASFREDVYLAGSVGPLGVRLKPFGRIKAEDARAAFHEQIAGLAQGGVDLIILETFSDRMELLEALAAAQEAAPKLPVVAQMTFGGDDRTLLGDLPAQVARDLVKAGADVIGVNCGGGPEQLSRILGLMRQAVPEAIISAMPNAGYPQSIGGRVMYPATTDYFADYALTFKALGAKLIGGCCGTTPEHIAAMRGALDNPALPLPEIHVLDPVGDESAMVPERPTELARKLAAGRFVVTVEMHPPRSFVPAKLLAAARLLQEAGADVLDVADSPTARMRMSPWAVCHFLQTQLHIETILHFPTRGRNLLRVQGDLLAAHALGLRNLFVVMGDPTRIGDYPEAMDNYDVAPSSLIGVVKHKMNSGVDQAGNSIGQPTSFTVGCALNMFADDLDKEINTLLKKLENGADFALGQAVFDVRGIEKFHARYRQITGADFNLPVLMGLMPLYSLKHAQFLHNEIPGITIPDPIMKRIEDAGETAPEAGVQIAQELLRDMRGLVAGAYIIPAFGHYELAAEVIDTVAGR
ncbi:MAG TPA: bifunctional homocysteine S-methyltransferase/methylenetetrahydrofolate reductase [Aggregatilineales bacterium]|nr:bifunctional homocysteine S-methyltransferase/methylenetetrahydrofolate reductase [Anaerolineae bacterium]HUN09619.1 bifunctional homocysteine S-methyltransferase/methylenetetrahydrofolate reductase [Aggregatilineales bacterium]